MLLDMQKLKKYFTNILAYKLIEYTRAVRKRKSPATKASTFRVTWLYFFWTALGY